MVELAVAIVRFRPQYVRCAMDRCSKTPKGARAAARKKAIVAVSRRIGVDLGDRHRAQESRRACLASEQEEPTSQEEN